MLHVYFFHFPFDENVYNVTSRIKLCFISFWLEVSSKEKSKELRISYLYYYQKKNNILTLIFSNSFTNLSNMFENLENFDTYRHILR
jgi:hypothetical protein